MYKKPTTGSPSPPSGDDSYVDLEPGWKLRVVVPLLTNGELTPSYSGIKTSENGITVAAPREFIGYSTSYYDVVANHPSGVSLHRAYTCATSDGHTFLVSRPEVQLFRSVSHAAHIRLLYLQRQSKADHNMAILTSSTRSRLDVLTKKMQADPANCKSYSPDTCEWIPVGVAVRPEAPGEF